MCSSDLVAHLAVRKHEERPEARMSHPAGEVEALLKRVEPRPQRPVEKQRRESVDFGPDQRLHRMER